MGYSILLTDIDNTLLDFTAGSHAALQKTMESLGVAFTQARLQRYLAINGSLWEAFERGRDSQGRHLPHPVCAFFRRAGGGDRPGGGEPAVYGRAAGEYLLHAPLHGIF